jgi:hypothetical protein
MEHGTYRCFNNISKPNGSSIDFSKCFTTVAVIGIYQVLVFWNWLAQDSSKTFIRKQTLAGAAWKSMLVRHWFSHNMFAVDGKHVVFLMLVSPLMFM